MAMFRHRLTKQQIESDYTHYAYLYGIVPVYFHESTNAVCVRNWWPEWLLDFFDGMFGFLCILATIANPEFEPMFPIKLTRKIKRDEHESD